MLRAAKGTVHRLEQNIAPLVKEAVAREDSEASNRLGDLEEGQELDYPVEVPRTTETTGR